MIHKLLCMVGATATSKTGLAVKLSKLFPSLLISADSRQVYQGMNIVTGKDHPPSVTLHGLDLVQPDEDFSVSQWQAAVMPLIKQAWDTGKLPIVVGGTGLYLRAVTEGIKTITIPPDPQLRTKLNKLSVSELQKNLQNLAPSKLASMNQSDRANPRRLIRAIEIAASPIKSQEPSLRPEVLIIGLKYFDQSIHVQLIKDRVNARLTQGALGETRALLDRYSPDLPSFTALGYRHLIDHLENKIDRDQLITNWTHEELAYSKRQLTWFNKVSGVRWFDPTDSHLLPQVASLVKDWYSNN